MPKESNLEFKVGLFVVVAFIALVIFILSVGDFAFFEEGKRLRVIFGFANGLKRSAPVRFAGVETGIVKDVNIFLDEMDGKIKVEVIFSINKDTKIPLDSSIMINQLGLFGEKYLEILPGENREKFYLEGDTIIGKDPIIQENISQRIIEIASKIEDGIDGVNNIITDKDNQHSLKMSLERLSYITDGLSNIINDEETQHSLKHSLQRLSSITESLDHIIEYIETGEGTIGKLIFDNVFYDELELFSSDIRKNPWKLLYKPKERKK